jgi:hypothetical protein
VVRPTVAGVPGFAVALDVLDVSVNVGVTTVSATRVVRVRPPPVPVMVSVEFPAVAVAAAEIVTVTEADVVSVTEENFTVTPEGAPLAERLTEESNPFDGVNVSVRVLDPPLAIVGLEVFGFSVKFTLVLLQ